MKGDYRARRERLGLSRRQVAHMAGMSERTLERIELAPGTIKLSEHEALSAALLDLEDTAHRALIARLKERGGGAA